jgi:hypothetical protein
MEGKQRLSSKLNEATDAAQRERLRPITAPGMVPSPAGRRRHAKLTSASASDLEFHPVTADRWRDLEQLFGTRGACGACWCMLWRLQRAAYDRMKGAGNRRAMKRLVDAGKVPGLLAYKGAVPIAWCSVAPRSDFIRLANSRVLKPIAEQPVWSISCLFVAKGFRRMGVSVEMIKATTAYVRQQGGAIVEAYPIKPRKASMPGVFAQTGLFSAYLRAGLFECLRRAETRPVVRFVIKDPAGDS